MPAADVHVHVLVLALGGCYGLGTRDCQVACGAGGECPGDLQCVEGMCRSGGQAGACADGDGGSSDGGTDAPNAPSTCGGPTLLSDDFNDGTLTGFRFAGSGDATGGESGGRLQLTPGVAPGSQSLVQSLLRYDLRGSAVYSQLSRVVDPAGAMSATFGLVYDPQSGAGFEVAGGKLACGTLIAGVREAMELDYDPLAHGWLRLREAVGQLRCDVSSDGAAWNEIYAAPMPSSFDLGVVTYGAIPLGAPGPGTLVEFDNLNGGGAPLGRFCPVAELVDDFADGAPGHLWDPFIDTICIVGESAGAVVVEMAEGTAGCGYASSTAYDVTGQGVWTRVLEVVQGGFTALTLDTGASAQDSLIIGVATGMLVVGAYVGGTMQVELRGAYDPAAHAYWRLREAGGMVVYETAPDGQDWTSQLTRPAPPWLAAARVRLAAGSLGMAATGQARFDEIRGVAQP
jgi:hypothetical protein